MQLILLITLVNQLKRKLLFSNYIIISKISFIFILLLVFFDIKIFINISFINFDRYFNYSSFIFKNDAEVSKKKKETLKIPLRKNFVQK